MSEILVIGKSGQMAQALAHAGAADLHCAGREEADLLNANAMATALDAHTPRIVLAATRDEVSVVDDQYGCPTHAPALAEALLQIAHKADRLGFGDWGTYHLAGAGETDRASMARQIFEASARHGGPVAKVKGIPTSAYPTPARRPLNARLDMSDTTRVFGTTLPVWTEGLEDTVRVWVRELRSS